ncbi:peroxisomal biogenesis factor 3 [[Candida] anglica]|uniref:Peroxin-3 n=1 Tax=[Candida] anglica TaxID=148631 RepID=A0ABP0E9Y2_9ASCO
MAIFSSLSTFFRRHRRKLVVSSSVALAAYFLFNHFVLKKIRSFQDSLKQEAFVREQIKRRFAQTQRDCYLTILALLPVLTQPIVDELPVELVTQALKSKKGGASNNNNNTGGGGATAMSASGRLTDSMLTSDNLESLERGPGPVVGASRGATDMAFYTNQSKTELWKLLKIKTITRFLTLVYSMGGLLIITRLSMNILARRSYLESAVSMAGKNKNPPRSSAPSLHSMSESQDYYSEQSYLSLSWWLLNKGWIQLADAIEPLVVTHFESVNARSELSIDEFESILSKVVGELNSAHYRSVVVSAIFPPNSQDALIETLSNTTPEIIPELYQQDSTLIKLVDETYYFIHEDPLFLDTYYNLVENSALVTLSQNLSATLEPERLLALDAVENADSNSKIFEVEAIPQGKKFKLASLLAQLSVQSGVLCDTNNLAPSPGSVSDDNDDDDEPTGNVFINNLDSLEILDELSASVYSNFQ